VTDDAEFLEYHLFPREEKTKVSKDREDEPIEQLDCQLTFSPISFWISSSVLFLFLMSFEASISVASSLQAGTVSCNLINLSLIFSRLLRSMTLWSVFLERTLDLRFGGSAAAATGVDEIGSWVGVIVADLEVEASSPLGIGVVEVGERFPKATAALTLAILPPVLLGEDSELRRLKGRREKGDRRFEGQNRGYKVMFRISQRSNHQ